MNKDCQLLLKKEAVVHFNLSMCIKGGQMGQNYWARCDDDVQCAGIVLAYVDTINEAKDSTEIELRMNGKIYYSTKECCCKGIDGE